MTVTSKPIVTMFYSVEHHPGITDRDAMLRYLGGNTGNLLFRYALQERIIDCASCQILPLPSTLDLFRSLDYETCRQVLSSALVIYPVANLLRPVEDFEANPSIQAETEFVTHLSSLFQGSLLVMGLGYQSRLRLEEGAIRDLHPLQVEMLDLLLQRTPGVTLRGNTTLAVLRQQEMFRHARLEALGCPRLMISPHVTMASGWQLSTAGDSFENWVGSTQQPAWMSASVRKTDAVGSRSSCPCGVAGRE